MHAFERAAQQGGIDVSPRASGPTAPTTLRWLVLRLLLRLASQITDFASLSVSGCFSTLGSSKTAQSSVCNRDPPFLRLSLHRVSRHADSVSAPMEVETGTGRTDGPEQVEAGELNAWKQRLHASGRNLEWATGHARFVDCAWNSVRDQFFRPPCMPVQLTLRLISSSPAPQRPEPVHSVSGSRATAWSAFDCGSCLHKILQAIDWP